MSRSHLQAQKLILDISRPSSTEALVPWFALEGEDWLYLWVKCVCCKESLWCNVLHDDSIKWAVHVKPLPHGRHFFLSPSSGHSFLPDSIIWFNSPRPSDAYMINWIRPSLVPVTLVFCSAPSHYVNRCWLIVHWALKNQLQWNYNENSGHFVSAPMCSWWRHQMETLSASLVLCGKFTGHRWIPLTKATDAELWCFLWSVPE